MNNKGFILDLPVMIIMIFIVVIACISIYLVMGIANNAIQAADIDVNGKSFYGDLANRLPTAFDSTITIVFFGYLIVLGGAAWYLATSPILFWILWIVNAIVLMITAYLANTFIDFSSGGDLALAAASFPIMSTILTYAPVIIAAFQILLLIMFFAKPSEAAY